MHEARLAAAVAAAVRDQPAEGWSRLVVRVPATELAHGHGPGAIQLHLAAALGEIDPDRIDVVPAPANWLCPGCGGRFSAALIEPPCPACAGPTMPAADDHDVAIELIPE